MRAGGHARHAGGLILSLKVHPDLVGQPFDQRLAGVGILTDENAQIHVRHDQHDGMLIVRVTIVSDCQLAAGEGVLKQSVMNGAETWRIGE